MKQTTHTTNNKIDLGNSFLKLKCNIMELKIKKEVEETVNIDTPVFFKNPAEQEYVGIFNDDTFIKFMQTNKSSSYMCYPVHFWLREIGEWSSTWNKITQEEFINIHEDFLSLHSMKHPLLYKANDDLSILEESYKPE